MVATGSARPSRRDDALVWDTVRDRLHARGLRWTPQRRALVAVLAETRGHITGAELVERCRERDPATIPSTVYRTLDVLEDLGIVRHGHGPDGREEYHVLPGEEHGHLHCTVCGGCWELGAEEARALLGAMAADRGFEVDLSHVTIVGRCRSCR
jgi:Fur family ferric uptake transcriptional regulator